MPILLFVVLLVTTFFAVYFMTKPTKEENNLKKRLDGYDRNSKPEEAIESDILKHEAYSDLPLLNAMLQRIKIAADVNELIKQGGVTWTVGGMLFSAIAILCGAGVVAALWFQSVMIGLGIGLAAGNLPYLFLLLKRRARLQRFATILPDAIDLLARALRAGHALTAAIDMVSREIPDPVGAEFRRVYEEQNFGLPIREALLNLAKRVPVQDLRFLITAMLVQKETGGNLAEVLDKAGLVIRERSRLLGQLRIYTAQGRMTGWVLGLLPFIVFSLMCLVNPSYARNLIDDPMGRKAIWVGLGLMVIGILSIRKIVDLKV
jgi:tight adherence protein B